jgi:hypothetical protein
MTRTLSNPRPELDDHVLEHLRVVADVPLVVALPVGFGAHGDLLPIVADEPDDDARSIVQVGAPPRLKLACQGVIKYPARESLTSTEYLAVRKSLAARKKRALFIPSRTSMSRVMRASDVVLTKRGRRQCSTEEARRRRRHRGALRRRRSRPEHAASPIENAGASARPATRGARES